MTDTARDMTLTLLAARSTGATICPSEVARAITCDGNWRDAMPAVHDAIDALLADGGVRLSWQSKPLLARAGPYRISRSNPDQSVRRHMLARATRRPRAKL